MASGFEKYPRGYDGDIDRYMMNVILLCEAMTQQQVQVRELIAPGGLRPNEDYEFRFMKDGVSVMIHLPRHKKEMVPSEIIAREAVAQLRGHWDNSVLKNVGGVLGGRAGREPDLSYYEKEMKQAIMNNSVAKGPIKTQAGTSGTKNTASPKKPDPIPKLKPPEYQVELQKRLDSWLN